MEPKTAKVIQLKTSRRGQVKCPDNGIVFPQLYRLTGFLDLPEEGDPQYGEIVRNDNGPGSQRERRPPSYTLDRDTTYGFIAEPVWTPINCLDPNTDPGWVIIRHHRSHELMNAYCNALFDTETYMPPCDRWLMFSTPDGYFTILTRDATPGTPDHVIVYSTDVLDETGTEWIEWFRVIGPDHQDMDIDALDPPHIRAYNALADEELEGLDTDS